jgi:hypothetical protein
MNGLAIVVVETAALLTSELVTNAIVHGAGEAVVAIDVGDAAVRVEVFDADLTFDLVPLRVGSSSVHGRGLAIVDALATSWGVEPRDGGKVVWFILDFARFAVPAPAQDALEAR